MVDDIAEKNIQWCADAERARMMIEYQRDLDDIDLEEELILEEHE